MSEGHFEAKVSAKRETASGIFLTLQVQPDDYTSDLATLRVGSALVIGWAEVVDTTVQKIESPVAQRLEPPAHNGLVVGSNPTGTTKERRPFDGLPLSQQAAIKCTDGDFRKFLANQCGADDFTEQQAAEDIRQRCDVDSRSQIKYGDRSGDYWLSILHTYNAWRTDRQYADSAR